MRLTWYGLSCFYLEGEQVRILMDPFDTTVGYTVPTVYADLWTCSHDHYDHNYRQAIVNDSVVQVGASLTYKNAHVYSVQTYHDARKGAVWGENKVFVVELDGLRIAHLGDLGELLNKGHLEKMGRIDILLIPVGGIYTINAIEAARVAKSTIARCIIPMHYATHHLQGFGLEEGIQAFTEAMNGYTVIQCRQSIEIIPEGLPEKSICVMKLD